MELLERSIVMKHLHVNARVAASQAVRAGNVDCCPEGNKVHRKYFAHGPGVFMANVPKI
jgi:hypothetical protein